MRMSSSFFLGVFNLQCTSNASAEMSLVSTKTPHKPKICNLWSQIVIQKDIAALDVSVDYSQFGPSMKICKPFSCANNYVKPLFPIQNLNLVFLCTYTIIVQKDHDHFMISTIYIYIYI